MLQSICCLVEAEETEDPCGEFRTAFLNFFLLFPFSSSLPSSFSLPLITCSPFLPFPISLPASPKPSQSDQRNHISGKWRGAATTWSFWDQLCRPLLGECKEGNTILPDAFLQAHFQYSAYSIVCFQDSPLKKRKKQKRRIFCVVLALPIRFLSYQSFQTILKFALSFGCSNQNCRQKWKLQFVAVYLSAQASDDLLWLRSLYCMFL